MKQNYFRKLITVFTLIIGLLATGQAQDLILTGVIDGDLTGGLPKAVELYVVNDIADMSTYSVAMFSNGSLTITAQFDFPAVAATAGDFISISGAASAEYNTFFGFDPDYSNAAINGNGDDGFAVLNNGVPVDRFGAEGIDGTGLAWEYTDGYAYRVSGTGPDALFAIDNWDVNYKALDTYLTNATALKPFPSKSYSPIAVADVTPPVWVSTYPMAANILETSFNIASQLDETSTVYYVVLASGETVPSVAEVMAGTGAAAAVAVSSGSFVSGSTETFETITGLTADATYSVYLVAEDDEATPNVQADVVSFDVTPTIPPTVLLKADFATDLSPFTPVSVIGDKVWLPSSGYAKISGYISGGSEANEDWLISPGIDLAASTQEVLSFETANNFGDAVTTLKVKISSDFSGTYDAASIAAATWEDITSIFTLSPGGSWTFVESGAVDFSPYAVAGTGYLAFVYECDNVNPGTWEIDNILYTGFLVPGADATLSDLQLDASTLSGFDAAVFSYTVELAAGTIAIPVVTATPTDAAATVLITPATDLSGDAAARTTTVVVTAQDGTTQATYSILFNPIIEVADIAGLQAATELTRKYVVTGEVVLTQKDGYRSKKYFEDASGAIEIDDLPGVITSVYEIGDGIKGLNGTLEVYNGWLQMHPITDPGATTSTGNAVVPQVITISEFNTNFSSYAAEFVKIEGLSFADAGGSFTNGGNYNVSVGADATVVRVHFYNVISGAIPKMADVQGVAVWHYSTAKIALRMQSDLMAYSSDASLSDLQVNASTVTGFVAGTLSYDVLLGVGTTTVPTVSYTLTDAGAAAVVTDATDLYGDEAARTASVEVTAADGTVATYTIVFTVDNTGVNNSATSRLSLYPVPATDVLNIKGMNDIRSIEIVNIVGNVVKSINVESEMMSINISGLSAGVYFIRANESTYRFIKK